MTDDVSVERYYRTDGGERRAAIIVDGEMAATLTGEQCTKIADELLLAADLLAHFDGGTDDEQRRHCPKCGERIASATITGPDGAELTPCGHVIPADHPVLSDTENENENDS